MQKSMYDIIKKQNGEQFAQTIRRHHSGIFDIPDLDKIVKYAGKDALPLLGYLDSLLLHKTEKHEITATPIELLDKAGYNAYYADTLQKQNAIRKYFSFNEELCTFKDAERYKKYHIINAVKKNVDEIKREDFKIPEREDAYGTSVISIQVLKTGGFVSIKNRYNHTVDNPDNTFYSNPDNIIAGLSSAIELYFNTPLYMDNTIMQDGYVIVNGQIINYTEEWDNCYFGKNFYLKDGVIHDINPDSQIMFNTYIVDLKTRSVIDIAPGGRDPFAAHLVEEIESAHNLHIKKGKEGNICLYGDNHPILTINSDGILTGVWLEKAIHIKDDFLSNYTSFNTKLEKISLPNTQSIGNHFLYFNEALTNIELPEVRTIGNKFLFCNLKIAEANLPKVINIGSFFMPNNTALININVSNVQQIGAYFLSQNNSLEVLKIPKATVINKQFLTNNTCLKQLDTAIDSHFGPYFLAAHPFKCNFIKKWVLSSVFQNNPTKDKQNF